MKIRTCKYCGKQYEATNTRSNFCSMQCRNMYANHQIFNDSTEHVECKICGFRGKQLIQHIKKVHKMSLEEYCQKFNVTKYDLMTESQHKIISNNSLNAQKLGKCGWQKGGKNPSQTEDVKNGRKSIYSKNYKGYDGLTDEEKEKRIHDIAQRNVKRMNENHNNPLRIDFYIKRGYSEVEAKNLLKDRQATFSLKKCIEKFGEIEGKKIFDARQEKWQNTLNAKPIEEIERINKAKMMNGRGYSKISQKLFDTIFSTISNNYSQIYYATINNKTTNCNKFDEFMVHNEETGNNYFLDFYVKDNNKVIEFDGDYWHGEKRGNQERDRKREEELKKLGFTNIFRVKERDYIADPDKVVKECVEFIRK